MSIYKYLILLVFFLSGCGRCGEERPVEERAAAALTPTARVVARAETGLALGNGVGLPGGRAAVVALGGVVLVEGDGAHRLHRLESRHLGGIYALDGQLMVLEFGGRRGLWLEERGGALSVSREVELGQGPRVYVEGGGAGWALTQEEARRLVRVGPGGAAEVVEAPGSTPAELAWAGGRLWIANLSSHEVTGWREGEEALRVPVGAEPYRLLVMGEELLVLHVNSPEVTRLGAATGSVLGSSRLGWIPTQAAWLGEGRVALLGAGAGRLWAGEVGALGAGEGAARVPVGSTSLLRLSGPEGRLWLAVSTGARGAVEVWEWSAEAGLVKIGEVSVGFAIGSLWAAPGETASFWVAGPESGRVARCAVELE